MKRKISLFVITILLVVVMPLKVSAANSVSITCNKDSYNVTEEATCTLKGTSTEDIISVSGTLDLESTLFDITPVSSSIWQGDANEGDIQLYTDEEKTGTFDIATIKVKMKQGASLEKGASTIVELKVDDVKFGNVDGDEESVTEITKTITFTNPKSNTPAEDEEDTKTTTTTKTNVDSTDSKTTTKTNADSTQKNPSTFDISIGLILILLALAVIGVIVSKKKLSNMDN